MEIKELTLNNGIPLITYKNSNAKTLGFSFLVKIGSVFEEKDKRGISHLLEHMMFKSNEKYKSDEINKAIELAGGKVNAYTAKDVTAFLFEVVPDGFEEALDIFYHMFKNKKYKENEFKVEKEVVKSEITIEESNPSYKIFDLAYKSLFGDSDFGEPIAGSIETVDNISREDLEEFKQNYYTTDNVVLFLAGNFKDKHVELINKTFGSLEETKAKRKKEPSINEGKNIVERMDTKNAFEILAFKHKVNKELFRHLYVFKVLISSGLSSLSHGVFREKYGLAYSVYLEQDYFYNKIFTNFLVFDGLNSDKENKVEDAFNEFVDKFKKIDEKYLKGRINFYKLLTKNYDTDLFFFLGRETYLFGKGYEHYVSLRDYIINGSIQSLEFLKENIENLLSNYKIAKIEPKEQ